MKASVILETGYIQISRYSWFNVSIKRIIKNGLRKRRMIAPGTSSYPLDISRLRMLLCKQMEK